MYVWGYNLYGQLGNGTNTDKNVPTKIGSLNNWSLISAGDYYNLALRLSADAVHSIPLKRGWNMVSSYINPSPVDSIQTVLNGIVSNLVVAKNINGNIYYPSLSINTIGRWNFKQGYMLYITDPDTLLVSGVEVVPNDNPISLTSGWNMIAYLRNSPISVIDAFASITDDDDLLIVKNISGQTYIPMHGVNTIGNLIPGQGYYIYVLRADSLLYPDN